MDDMNDLIQRLVDRFLGWTLPKDFHPDAGITFTPPNNEAWWPVGTNLFTADQAKQMFEQIVTPELEKEMSAQQREIDRLDLEIERLQRALESQQARIRRLEEALHKFINAFESDYRMWMMGPIVAEARKALSQE